MGGRVGVTGREGGRKGTWCVPLLLHDYVKSSSNPVLKLVSEPSFLMLEPAEKPSLLQGSLCHMVGY